MKTRIIASRTMAICLLAVSGCVLVQAQDVTASNDPGPPQNSSTEPQPTPAVNVADLDVSQLMNMKVTSVSKKEQKLSHVAAAIFVITQEEIRRSGATNIPDLLRMVPGMNVAQIDASSWAISIRGFNHQFSDKLLVLIDGRAVYTPLFSGVYWDTQDVLPEDIDRIEVIRGPGATVWGANAVNGVINIITLKAASTQGGLITAGSGTQDLGTGAAQYGGKAGRGATYRIFAKGFDHNHFPDLAGQSGEDGWHMSHGGFRLDDSLRPHDSVTLQGDIYGGSEGSTFEHIASIAPPVNETVKGSADLAGGNLLTRWHHAFSSRSDTTLQLYFDRAERRGPESNEYRNTFDIDFQHHLAVGTRHDFVWGADYRHTADDTAGTIDQAWSPNDRSLDLFSVFAQDEIALKPDHIFLTLGTKLENSSLGGFDVEPSVRIAWTPRDEETFWAAISRAGRSPGRRNVDADINVAVFPGPGAARQPNSGFSATLMNKQNMSSPTKPVTARNRSSCCPSIWRFSLTPTANWRRQNPARHSSAPTLRLTL